jgi:hypothetical protein
MAEGKRYRKKLENKIKKRRIKETKMKKKDRRREIPLTNLTIEVK